MPSASSLAPYIYIFQKHADLPDIPQFGHWDVNRNSNFTTIFNLRPEIDDHSKINDKIFQEDVKKIENPRDPRREKRAANSIRTEHDRRSNQNPYYSPHKSDQGRAFKKYPNVISSHSYI